LKLHYSNYVEVESKEMIEFVKVDESMLSILSWLAPDADDLVEYLRKNEYIKDYLRQELRLDLEDLTDKMAIQRVAEMVRDIPTTLCEAMRKWLQLED